MFHWYWPQLRILWIFLVLRPFHYTSEKMKMHQCFLSTERWRDFKTQESPAERNAWVSVKHVIILKFSYSKSTILNIFKRKTSAFKELRFHEGLAWTVVLTVKLRFQISPVKCLLEKRKHAKCYIYTRVFFFCHAGVNFTFHKIKKC